MELVHQIHIVDKNSQQCLDLELDWIATMPDSDWDSRSRSKMLGLQKEHGKSSMEVRNGNWKDKLELLHCILCRPDSI